MRTLVWFRGKDLRLSDHLPLHAALGGRDVIGLFVLDPFFFSPARARELPHRTQFLLESLAALERDIRDRGSKLCLLAGKSVDVVPDEARRWRVDRVVAQRWTEPFGRVRDERVGRALGVPFDLFDGETLAPWCAGLTGYPVVDAAARQLLGEGFVHNRARMIAASFLTKDLGIDYRRGEAHYLRYLVDGDWAQNNFNWQWIAGSGFDAAPYFRVFNLVEQGKRFDPNGDYVRRWIPELSRLAAPWVHEPWRASKNVLLDAGITLGSTYPRPIVDHQQARRRYLASARR